MGPSESGNYWAQFTGGRQWYQKNDGAYILWDKYCVVGIDDETEWIDGVWSIYDSDDTNYYYAPGSAATPPPTGCMTCDYDTEIGEQIEAPPGFTVRVVE